MSNNNLKYYEIIILPFTHKRPHFCNFLTAVSPPALNIALSLWPTAQQQVDFLLLRRQAFMRAALRSKQMKVNTGWLLFVTVFLQCPMIRSGLFMTTRCVCVCACAGHDGGGAASPTRQGPGPHGICCQVWAPYRHHKGARQLGRKWVVSEWKRSARVICVVVLMKSKFESYR